MSRKWGMDIMSKEVQAVQVLETREVFNREFKIYGTKDEPLFLARDLAEMIDYTRNSDGGYHVTSMLQGLDPEETITSKVLRASDNRFSNMRFVTEDGLYEILMRSTKPIAKQFKKEVKKILKEIRLTGGYIPIKADESDDEFLARAFVMAQNKLAKRDAELKQAREQILIDAPKVEYYDNILTADDNIYSFTDLINELNLNYRKAEDLSKALHKAKVIHYPQGKKDGFYLTANYSGKGYTETYSFVKETKWGDKVINNKGWTAKGKELIWELS